MVRETQRPRIIGLSQKGLWVSYFATLMNGQARICLADALSIDESHVKSSIRLSSHLVEARLHLQIYFFSPMMIIPALQWCRTYRRFPHWNSLVSESMLLVRSLTKGCSRIARAVRNDRPNQCGWSDQRLREHCQRRTSPVWSAACLL